LNFLRAISVPESDHLKKLLKRVKNVGKEEELVSLSFIVE
jgi:hypothetical protein